MAAETQHEPLTDAEADRLLSSFANADGLGLAVSGGPDSVALMRLVAGWRVRQCPDLPVIVLTVDHGLRPEAAAEARQVATWARDCGLTHRTLHWEGHKPVADIQAAARTARYRLMADACANAGLSHLLTAHHLDDQAETLLLRLARGSGVDGLSAMPEAARWPGLLLARPFIDVPRGRLAATLAALGQPWIDDPSNDNPKFARVRLRSMMPSLAAEGMTARRLAETAKRMRRARAALETMAADLHRTAVTEDMAGFCRVDLAAFGSAPEEIGLRVLARLLMGIGGSDYPPRLECLERLYDAVLDDTRSGGGATLCGCRIVRSGTALIVFRETGRTGLPVQPVNPAGTLVWDRRFRIDAACDVVGSGLQVRALGEEGVKRVRENSSLRIIPVEAARVSPGIFDGDRLIAAPLVEDRAGGMAGGPYSPPEFAIAFTGRSRFAGAPDGM